MALPGESIDQLNDEATAWRLLEPWDAHPRNARLERHAVYRFQARWVKEWRRGRVLLAGDAAHQTPPFAGQGLCAGLRDAANLAWKLGLVLAGTSPDSLLDAYGTERAPNMEAVIDLAIEMGKMICVCDPDEVRARDEMFLAGYDGGVTAIPPFPGISDGIVLPGSPKAGELFVQGDVERNGQRVRFDDAVGAGWRLVTNGPVAVDAALADRFESMGGAVVAVGEEPGLLDVDGTYHRWFDANRVHAALQRPDFALFGTATDPSEVDALLRALQARLAAP
jgi:3-(3-hydroxy-phenyl)propionate hydroxylase